MNHPDTAQATTDTARQSAPTGKATLLHLLLVVLAAVAVGLGFLREPGFGDDLTYWSFAFDLHEKGLSAWQRHSFHDLRWPVWGVCWLLQKLLGFGLASYYGTPILYSAAGALLCFTFARKLTHSPATAGLAAVIFLFHPLLDTVCYRPMPDLSEGVWGGAAILAWWACMTANNRRRSLLFAALTSAAIFIVESNRITGAFIVPVVVLATLVYFRRRFGWLLAAGAICVALYALEAAFYHQLFGDWLHNLHANLGNKGAKGTGAIALWQLPVRFFVVLWKGSPLAPFYSALAIIGLLVTAAPALLQRFTKPDAPSLSPVVADARLLAKVMMLWLGVLYFEYSGVPQSFEGGWNPLIRDAVRFLCGLLIPLSVFTALGLASLCRAAQQIPALGFAAKRPALCAGLGLLGLIAATSRDFTDLGYARQMRQYMATLPAQTKVFTHTDMRAIAFLVDASKAQSFQWLTPKAILRPNPDSEAIAAGADEFWYAHKLVWLTTRKALEKKNIAEPLLLASYFDHPLNDWVMTRLLTRDDTPDLIFQRRRKPADPAPRVLSADAPEFAQLFPALPAQWQRAMGEMAPVTWKLPESFRGQYARMESHISSEQVEAFALRLRFLKNNQVQTEYMLKPYLHHQPNKVFFAFEIPADADQCVIQLRFAKQSKTIRFEDFKLLLQAPPAAP